MNIKLIFISFILTFFNSIFLLSAVQAEELNIDNLLDLVQKGQSRDNSEYTQRMQQFTADSARQSQLAADATAERKRLEESGESKEKLFADNEVKIAEAQTRLNDRLGTLKELFGVLQQVSGDTKSIFEGSVISSELPSRDIFLTELIRKAGSTDTLPTMNELEQLWYEMQREMTYSGKISKYEADVVLPAGNTEKKQVVRVGSFNVISSGNYLIYDFDAKKLVQLANQPADRFQDSAKQLEVATGAELTGFWLDPSRGQLLQILGQTASFMEKVDQGGLVGYVIMVLGVFALIIAFWRMFALQLEAHRVSRQMQLETPDINNSLGRVMTVYNKYKEVDIDTLELHLAEAISKEIPPLSKGISWIKIISVVSPLLGLLGTVTGMITVFETLALFGSGDPKLMSDGISQALVTTVQGLVVAIPCVFFFTMANNKSRGLTIILEERATGILARKSELLHTQISVNKLAA